MSEPISTTSILISLIKPIIYVFGKVTSFFLPRNPKKILERRLKWEPLIRTEISNNHKQKLGMDIIVHDIARFFKYPEIENTFTDKLKSFFTGNRISPWFKAGLVGVGSQEVMFLLGWYGLKQAPCGKGWITTSSNLIDGDTTTYALIGYVPLEHIVEFSFNGDDWYSEPHIYCNFAIKGMPYNKIAYCKKRDRPDIWPYYQELEEYSKVRKLTEWYEPYLNGSY